MLGAVVYLLRAENEATLIPFHGKLLHGTLFNAIKKINLEAAGIIHDEKKTKIFSFGLLESNEKNGDGEIFINPTETYRWRVTALNEEMLKLLLNMPLKTKLKIGRATMSLEEIVVDGRWETGIVIEDLLISQGLFYKNIQSITFDFLTPTTFHRGNKDYPFPLPELIFGSLSRKWQDTSMPMNIDPDMMREISWNVKPLKWHGHSIRGYIAKNQGITGFVGSYTYSLEEIQRDLRCIFLILAQYAEFAGVGRLTAQGFGRTRISFS